MLNRCCCMRLNTFGVVIGWLGVVGSFIGLIVTTIGLIKAREFAEMFIKNAGPDMAVDVDTLTNLIIIGSSIYLGLSLISLLSSALLVFGTVKERHLLLLPWIINSGIGFLFNILYQLAMTSTVIWKGNSASEIFPPVIASILVIVFQFYIIYAVYSLYKQIQANREQQTPLVRHSAANPGYPSYTKI